MSDSESDNDDILIKGNVTINESKLSLRQTVEKLGTCIKWLWSAMLLLIIIILILIMIGTAGWVYLSRELSHLPDIPPGDISQILDINIPTGNSDDGGLAALLERAPNNTIRVIWKQI